MKKLALKIVVFSILFFIGLSLVDHHFKERRISYLDREIYKALDRNVEIAIFGSSHGMNGIDPRILQKELHKTTYNFSSAGQRLVSTMAVIDEVLSDNEVELAIVDIFPGTISSIRRTEIRKRAFQYNTFDNLDFSLSKVIAHTRVNGIESFLDMSPTIRRHHHWPDVLRGEEIAYDPNSDFNNGFFSRFYFDQRMWDNKIADLDKNVDKDIPVTGLTKGEKRNIDDIVKRFKRKGISLLFISVPYYQDTLGIRAISHQKYITEYLQQIKVPYVEFNSLWEDLELSQDEFTDAGHVNTKAAIKLSEHLADYIGQNFELSRGEIPTSDFLNNRYAIIDQNLDEIPINLEFDSTHVLQKKGYNKLYGFKAYHNKFELLFEGNPDEVQPLDIRYEYRVDSLDQEKLSQRLLKFIDEQGRLAQRKTISSTIKYKGKAYGVFQIETPFERLQDFSLLFIDGKTRKEIFKVDSLLINLSEDQ